jgi:hypothetical protein
MTDHLFIFYCVTFETKQKRKRTNYSIKLSLRVIYANFGVNYADICVTTV